LGNLAIDTLASGYGWSVGDVVCTSGPQDRPFEERHGAVRIAVVLEGSFQYRAGCGSEVMSPGSLLLGSYGQSFECRHEHGSGDRCVSVEYSPDFLERAGVASAFPVRRIPPIAALAPWVVEARLGVHVPERVVFEELAHGLVGSVLGVLDGGGSISRCRRSPTSGASRRRCAGSTRTSASRCRFRGWPRSLG
jgi:AraC family transcriptional regulator